MFKKDREIRGKVDNFDIKLGTFQKSLPFRQITSYDQISASLLRHLFGHNIVAINWSF